MRNECPARGRVDRDVLFEQYLPLARSLAVRYRNSGESLEDLMQVAAIGLLKAIDRFDPTHGVAFSTFAVPTIRGELCRHLRDHTWSVHVPRGLRELSARIGKATNELSSQLARSPTTAELAERLEVTESQVLEARGALDARSPASLDDPLSAEEQAGALRDLICGEDDALAAVEAAVLVDNYLARLPQQQRQVLRLRFKEDLKQREIAAMLGITQMRVSRLIRQSIEQIRSTAAAA